ncbi:hypothetical protein D9M69_631240 [compost metagenome]
MAGNIQAALRAHLQLSVERIKGYGTACRPDHAVDTDGAGRIFTTGNNQRGCGRELEFGARGQLNVAVDDEEINPPHARTAKHVVGQKS